MMSSLDAIRNQMARISAQKEAARQKSRKGLKKSSLDVAAVLNNPHVADAQQFLSLEGKILDIFHAGGGLSNQVNIAKYIKLEVPTCRSVIMLRMTEKGHGFRLYCRDLSPQETYESYRTSDFQCVEEVINARAPVLHNDESKKKLSLLVQWKPIFGYIPDIVIGIPIVLVNDYVGAVVAISFKNKLPKGFLDRKLFTLHELLDVLVPYVFNNQGTIDNNETLGNFYRVMDSIKKIERVIGTHSPTIALTQIGTEITQLGGTKGIVMFTIDEDDNILRKFHTNFGTSGKITCPNKDIHSVVEFGLADRNIAALSWVVANRRGMKINAPSDLEEYGINAKAIHAIGNCNTKSMLVVPVVDYSREHGLVIELSDKIKKFTPKEFEMILLLCQHSACLLTTTVLLDRREKNFRRRNIINEVLCSITIVKPTKVEQFINHHRRTSNIFKGHFDDFNLCIRCFPEQDIAGIALELFYELDIVKDFKLKRSVLVRFILSVQQGYGPLPYHNWYHAVSVAHFTYLLIRRLKLVEIGHFSKLEAFALVVSALTHDIDHRGTNNQFQSYTNSEIYKLYACEDSVMERHHLSIALAILHREDCNILETFSDPDYKYFVELLTWNIIATDISKHLKSRAQLFNEANSVNPRQRKMAKLSLLMTAADLCDNCKKWDDNLPTVKSILQEFFDQGDMERRLGFTPIQMMDRRIAYIPLIEYKFTKYIVAPVYSFLTSHYELLRPCLENIRSNENLWTISTAVFDRLKDDVGEQLDILDLPDVREDALRKVKLDMEIDEIKTRKFSLPPPVPVPPAVTVEERRASVPSVRRPSTIGVVVENDEDLEEVDTGEKRRSIFSRLCCCCCRRRK